MDEVGFRFAAICFAIVCSDGGASPKHLPADDFRGGASTEGGDEVDQLSGKHQRAFFQVILPGHRLLLFSAFRFSKSAFGGLG
jgi:hypothetical protein